MFDEIVAGLTSEKVESVLASDRRFRLEDGRALLEAKFGSVVRHDLPAHACSTGRTLFLTDSTASSIRSGDP
jgi:hypothetical protein